MAKTSAEMMFSASRSRRLQIGPVTVLADDINKIAGDIRLSPATVRRAIKDLRKAGLIETKQRYREKGGKSTLLFSVYHR